MVNDDTGLIEEDVPTVLDYLFTAYGKVTVKEVNKKEHEYLNVSFNPADPMITIYRSIKQLQKKAIEARIPYSEAHLLKFGLSLICSTRNFEKALECYSGLYPLGAVPTYGPDSTLCLPDRYAYRTDGQHYST